MQGRSESNGSMTLLTVLLNECSVPLQCFLNEICATRFYTLIAVIAVKVFGRGVYIWSKREMELMRAISFFLSFD